MRNNAGHLLEVVWFVLGGLMIFMGVDMSMHNGLHEGWYYFLFGALAFLMYYLRRRNRMQRR